MSKKIKMANVWKVNKTKKMKAWNWGEEKKTKKEENRKEQNDCIKLNLWRRIWDNVLKEKEKNTFWLKYLGLTNK